jgi:hydroxymethylpyrimidine pyrophosphatase-like HAD family hydrolase
LSSRNDDGTLLFREDDTNIEVWKKLNKMENNGVVVSFVTARPYAFCTHLMSKLTNTNYHIFDKGAYVASRDEDGASIELPPQISEAILDIFKYELSARIGLSVGRYFYVNETYFEEIESYLKTDSFKLLKELNDFDHVNSIWLRDVPKRYEQQILNLATNTYYVRSAQSSKEGCVDMFVNSYISQKDVFLNFLCRINNVDIINSVGIGDSAEDLPFISISSIRGCPAYANDKVKNICDYISGEKYSSGLLELLNKIFI